MTIRIISAVFASLLLCGCSVWGDTMDFVFGPDDQTAEPAETPAVATAPAPPVQASTPDDWCKQIAKAAAEEAAGEGFDSVTQQKRADTTYQQCVAPADSASH